MGNPKMGLLPEMVMTALRYYWNMAVHRHFFLEYIAPLII